MHFKILYKNYVLLPIRELQKLVCTGPQALAGRQLSDLTEKDLCPAGEIESEPNISKGSLEASRSTSDNEKTRGSGNIETIGENGNDIGPSGGTQTEPKKSQIRSEVIIAGTVVGVLILLFVVFFIVYKCRHSRNRSKEERASRTHQNKRYVYVILPYFKFT